MSKKDLIPIRSKEQAKKLGSLGGKSTSLAKKLARRKKCNPNCPIYHKCWAISYSDAYEGQCALKQMPLKIQRRTIRLIEGGVEGFNDELISLLLSWSAKVATFKGGDEKRYGQQLIHDTIKVREAIHGKQSNVKLEAEGSITINDLKEVLKERLKRDKNGVSGT